MLILISQLLAAAKVGRRARRLFITGAIRVTETPPDWGIAFVRITPPDEAKAARASLEAGAFEHVEISYLRDRGYAELAAFFRQTANTPHGEELVAGALGDSSSYLTTGITLTPPSPSR